MGEAGLHDGLGAGGIGEVVVGGGVDAGPAFLGGASDGGGLFAKDHAAVGDGVNADVEKSAAGETGGVHAVPRHHFFAEGGHVAAEVGVKLLDFPDGLFGEELLNTECDGTEACPHGFHHEEVFLAGEGDDLLGLAGVLGEGFFDEYGKVVLEAEAYVFGMKVVAGGDVDSIEFFLFEHGFIGGVDIGNTGDLLKVLSASGGAGGGGDNGSFSAL